MKQITDRHWFLSILFMWAMFFFLSFSLLAVDSLEESFQDHFKIGINTKTLSEKTPIVKESSAYVFDGTEEHWGLSHWISGIGEYLQRCLFCCNYNDSYKGRYATMSTRKSNLPQKQQDELHYYHGYHIENTTDCFCMSGRCSDICTIPCVPLLCCPCIALGHSCCLPIALCESKGERSVHTSTAYAKMREPVFSPVFYPAPPAPPSEEEKKRQKAHQDWRMREWASGDLDRRIKAGMPVT